MCAEYADAFRKALYNFSDHPPVRLELEINNLWGKQFPQPSIAFNANSKINNILKLKIDFNIITNQTLNVYEGLAKLIKTIDIKKSIYITEPLKFVKAH